MKDPSFASILEVKTIVKAMKEHLRLFNDAWSDYRFYGILRGLISFLEIESLTDRIYDVGCGDLFYIKEKLDEDATLVAIDYSRRALVQARRRSRKFDNVFLVMADAEFLPFIVPFEMVLCIDTIHWNPGNEQMILDELARLSLSRVVFSIHHKEDPFRDDISVFEEDEIIEMCTIASLNVVSMKVFDARDIFPQYDENKLIAEGYEPDQKINIHVECVKK